MRALGCRKEHVERPCGPGNPGTLGKKGRKILWLDQIEQQQGVADVSGEVSGGPERHTLGKYFGFQVKSSGKPPKCCKEELAVRELY